MYNSNSTLDYPYTKKGEHINGKNIDKFTVSEI